VPRWTRKFHIKKGYVTTRNKYMRCEKLFYSYEVLRDRYHEQSYRVGKHDEGMDAVPCGYNKQSPNRSAAHCR
jgi:hypothetical protein